MMTHQEALQPIVAHRGERVVITTMRSVGLWPTLANHPRDFHYLPSSMGQAVPLGLGLALAQPGLGVIVVTGDGGLLMNLGSLVTLAQHAVPVAVVLIDNGLYEVTGGQSVVGAGRTDYAGLARAAGIPDCYRFESESEWAQAAPQCLSAPGLVFVALQVAGEHGQETPTAPQPMEEQIRRLRNSLGVVVA